MGIILKIIKSAAIFGGLLGILLYFSNFKTPETENRSYKYPIPSKISFCDKDIPLNNELVFESLDRELIINMYWHSRTIYTIKRANRYFPMIERVLDSMNIPNDFKYLAVIESGLMNVASPAGAKGYWQFLEGTGKEFGLEITETVDERLHFYKSTVAACKYLQKSYYALNDWALCAASYNMGLNGIRSVIEAQQQQDYFKLHLNEETGRYIYRILATKFIFENAEEFGFEWKEMRKYKYHEPKIIPIDTAISDLRMFCTNNNFSYKELKAYNPWLINTKLAPARGKTYYLELPQ